MLCNEIKICKRAASTHAPERHYFRLKRDAMFPLSPFVVVSVVSQTVEWVARERGPHYDCMFDERLNFASFPFPLFLLNEEDIKLKSQARSNGRSERVGGVRGDAAYIFVLYYSTGAIPVASPLPRSLPPPFRIILFLLIALLPTTIIPRRRRKRRRQQKRKISPSSDLSKEQSRILEEGRRGHGRSISQTCMLC